MKNQKNAEEIASRDNSVDLGETLVGKVESKDSSSFELKSVRHCVYSLRFWQYFAILIAGNFFATFFNYSYKPFGENTSSHGQIDDKTLTWAASIGAGLNGLSRIFFGSLVDKYSFKTLMSVMMTIQLVNACVCFWAAHVPALFFICIMVNYLVLGGFYTIFPVSITNVFGLELGP